jgi:hypothetical protein
MVHIKKIKTFYGVKYAVVDSFTSTTVVEDKLGKMTSRTETKDYPVEYAIGTGKDKMTLPAIFDVTEEGLEKAKEIQALYKKKNNKK